MERNFNNQTDQMEEMEISRNRTMDDESTIRPVSNPGGEDGDEDYQDEEDDVVYNEDDLDDVETEPVAADLDDVETERDLDEDDLDDEDLVVDEDAEEDEEDDRL